MVSVCLLVVIQDADLEITTGHSKDALSAPLSPQDSELPHILKCADEPQMFPGPSYLTWEL